MERRFILRSVLGIVVVTSFFALYIVHNLIQIEEERTLNGTIYEVTEYSEVNYLFFEDHYNLSLYTCPSFCLFSLTNFMLIGLFIS
ncbi:MAG: hypothetical protein ACFE98_20910, partial [Candidatus Hermodarchaeota archaeon]